ncbi:SfnB family sulfur acquisition oxidoreductase [Acidisoma silvae]|uniref:SfnB family sulfur acquisition oxidoreductase n=1 Tax=Acidisoma silvae TaxID=2802396 RepID=A0A963YW76_9PROT|nr:SfnB family sulfur acquisition oxidoreductase [Acidisoma silvae]MCB8877989.1 SfnB family sulfur acquisition oxidoreductase [Acidisoma silvae]
MSEAPPEPRVDVIRTDAEALIAARALAAEFAAGAAVRDRQRLLPIAEIDRFSQSGLWGAIVPRAWGGAGIAIETLAEVTAIIAEADPSLGQIPQNHWCLVDALRLAGTEEQKRIFFAEVLAGRRFGNAVSEFGTRTFRDIGSRLTQDGGLRLNARKAYATGAFYAHWIPIAAKDDQGQAVMVYVPNDAPGLTIVDDWDGFGQRTTASGTVLAENIAVEPWQVLARHRLFQPQTIHAAYAQLLHAAIDLGIARAALADLEIWLTHHVRTVPEAAHLEAGEDPLTLHRAGSLVLRLHAAEALLTRAARALEQADGTGEASDHAQATVAVAEAKIATTELSLDASSTLIELGGTQSTRLIYGLDRHWRNARTHTVHDPVRWKFHTIGHFWLHDRLPAPQSAQPAPAAARPQE